MNQMQRKNRRMNNVCLAQCTQDYLKALTAPADYYRAGKTVCIPDTKDQPTYKWSTLQRGTAYVGTIGYGFVHASTYNTTSDVANVNYTGANFTGSVYTGSGAGVNSVNNSRSPFTDADNRPSRMVAAELRVRYTGTELNRSGIIIPYSASQDADANLLNNSIDATMNFSDARTYPCDRNWHGTIYRLSDGTLQDYTIQNHSSTTHAVLLAGFTGVTGSSYEWEFVAFWESRPSGAGAGQLMNMTKSHSDLVGYGMVRDVIGSITGSESGRSLFNKAVQHISRAALSGLSSYMGLGPSALPLAIDYTPRWGGDYHNGEPLVEEL